MLANGWKAVEDRCWCWLTEGRELETGVGAG